MKNILIIGGSSGLGYELAKLSSRENNKIYITGRKRPVDLDAKISFISLELGDISGLTLSLNNFIDALDFNVDVLIYAAGIFNRGIFDEVSDEDFFLNTSVNYLAPQLLMRNLMQKQKTIDTVIGISSVAQFRIPEDEPYYSANKTGFGKFMEIISQDPRIQKTILVSPGGMNTTFWRDHPKSQEKLLEYLDPVWVADQTIQLLKNNMKYQSYIAERSPARMVKEKTRD